MVKIKIKNLISLTVLILIISFFIKYLLNNLSDFRKVMEVGTGRLWILGVVILIILLILFINGFLLKILMEPFKIQLKTKEWWGLSVITYFYNIITPFRGGAIVRSLYLKKKYDFPYTYFISTLSALYIIIFLVGSLVGMLSMFFIWFFEGKFNFLIFIVLLIIFLFFLSLIIFSPKLPKREYKWLITLNKVLYGWNLIKKNKKILLSTIFISLIQIMLTALGILLIYSLFFVQIGMLKSIFIASVNTISLLIQITPGNLGLGDAILVFSANIVGIELTEAIAATIFKRIIELVIILILGPIFSYSLMKDLRNSKSIK